MFLRALFAVFIFALPFTGKATDFVVTSNADNGPGTLREAITLAAANGTAAADRILFNLPDLSVTGRTIVLESALPQLSSRLEIDGSSQPGSAFGVSDAKVWIQYRFSIGSPLFLFMVDNCTNVGIYGLKMDSQITWTAFYEETTCISIQRSSNVQIGAPGKGNLIINWIHAIAVNSRAPDRTYWSSNIFIRSNILGIEEDGETAAMNEHLLEIFNIENLEVGGLDPREGNVMATERNRVLVSSTRGNILIAQNKIGTNFSGTTMLSLPYGESNALYHNIFVANSMWAHEVNYVTDVRILNNLSTGYCAAGIAIRGIGKKFFIQGNLIGTDISGVQELSPGMDYGVFIENSRDGVIGVENDEATERNIIAFAKKISSATYYIAGSGIGIANTQGVVISRNSIFCDEQKGIAIDTNGAYKAPLITINAIDANSVSGTAPPNSKIEVFRDDNCPNCEGKTYLETFYADANGRWERNNASPKDLVFTATDPVTHTTSEFSAPYFQGIGWRVIPASCGESNGAITGWQIRSGTEWHWEDDRGNIVGRDTNLIGVPPGDYRLVVSIDGGCSRSTELITVLGETLPDALDVAVTTANCGLNNGSAYINSFVTDLAVQWLDVTGNVLSDQVTLNGLLPGAYFVKLSSTFHADCNKTYGPFTIANASGPSLDLSGVNVEAAQCGNSTGNIRGIQVLNASGGGYIAWKNESGQVVGNSLELPQQPAGRYQLIYKEDGGCDTIRSAYILVPAEGEIGIDERQVQVLPAACNGQGGAISGLSVSGAESFTWHNLADGAVVGNRIDLANPLPGRYQLTAANSVGCSLQSASYEIKEAVFQAPAIARSIIRDAYCNRNNGSVTVELAGEDPANYTFQWVGQGSNFQVGSDISIDELPAGDYELYATDKNQCSGLLLQTSIKALPAANFVAQPSLQHEICSQQNGSIKGIQLNGLQGPASYTWYDAANQIVGEKTDIDKLATGSYQLKVVDAGVCEITSPVFHIENRSSVLESPRYQAPVIPVRQRATLTIQNAEAATYDLFADAAGTQLLETNNSGNFTTGPLEANTDYYIQKRINECRSALVRVAVTVVEKSFVRVPNAFTPNADGKNDVLHLKVIGIVQLDYFNVYDRFGNLVFSSSDPAIGWDGRVRGQAAPSGNFVWMAGGKDYFGQPFKEKGTVLLIR